ncbi:MAG: hypothetical protein EAZ95_01990 [Bacteroidetes bacterium]|nr:MAG: hypothetical protein EAZ95_01990 [Bacteroidota bacterium]
MENLSIKQLACLEINLRDLMGITYNIEFSDSRPTEVSSKLSSEDATKLDFIKRKIQQNKETYQKKPQGITSFTLNKMYEETAQKLTDFEVMAMYLGWSQDFVPEHLAKLWGLCTKCINRVIDFETSLTGYERSDGM